MTYISIVAKIINENSDCTCKFLSSNFVSKYGSNPKSNMLNIQSFPQNYQQLALPRVDLLRIACKYCDETKLTVSVLFLN